MKNFKKSIQCKLNVKNVGILLGALLLLSPNIMAKKFWEYSLDTNFREFLPKWDGDLNHHPSIYDKKIKQDYEVSKTMHGPINKNVKQKHVNSEILQNPILNQVNSLHPEVRWMFSIDGQYLKYGPAAFDEKQDNKYNPEPGFIFGASKGFEFVFDLRNMQKKLDADYYLELHRTLVKYVCLDNHDSFTPYEAQNYRSKRSVGFGICMDDKGYLWKCYNEYYHKMRSSWESDKAVFTKTMEPERIGYWTFIAPDLKSGDAERKVNIIFEEYYSKLEEIEKNGFAEGSKLPQDASIKDKKLEVIVRICQNLEQLHAFPDGNLRTVNMVFQRMLVENNFKPSILHKMSYLDVDPVDYLFIRKIDWGQRRYDEVLKMSDMLYSKGVPSATGKNCNPKRVYKLECLNPRKKNFQENIKKIYKLEYLEPKKQIFQKYIKDSRLFREMLNEYTW